MIITTDTVLGEILDVVKEGDESDRIINIPTLTFEKDEGVPANTELLKDLWALEGVGDIDGYGKYYIDTLTGDIMEREGWEEAPW